MSKIISWAANVNTKVLEDTTIKTGKGYIEDKESNGTFTNRRLTSLLVPDVFNVVMVFDWSDKKYNGLSEFDLFMNWYKFEHQRGVNPFQFPSITKFGVNGTTEMSYYKITGDLNIQKSALAYKVSMEWTEFITQAISIPDEDPTIVAVNADPSDTEQNIYVSYSQNLKNIPLTTDISVVVNGASAVTPVFVSPSYELTNQYKFKLSNNAWATGSYLINVNYEEDGVQKTLPIVMEVA